MVSETFRVDNIKTIVVLVYIALSTLTSANQVYYGPPVKVQAQFGITNKDNEKLLKDTKSIESWRSQVVYKPLSPLEKDLENILNSYWNKTYDKMENSEYTSELPTKLVQIKPDYKNSIINSYIKHKEETAEPILSDRVHLETNLNIHEKLTPERHEEENITDREFVNRSSIITKSNFSYYHPIHKKYYNITATSKPHHKVSSQYYAPTSSNHINTYNASKVSYNVISNKINHNKSTSDNKPLDQKVGHGSNKVPYKTTQVPFKPTGGPYRPITAMPLYPTMNTIKNSNLGHSFGPQKPLFGHNPSVFESFNKKSNNRKPHKVAHKKPHHSFSGSPSIPKDQYINYKPVKPQVHSNISPTGHIPSSNHPPFWNQITNSPPHSIPTKVPNTWSPSTYKPIYLHTPVNPGNPNNDISYKPTSTTSSQGIVINKPISIEFTNKPSYKPTYRPVTVEAESQLVLETPSLIEEIILPEEVVIDEPVSVVHEHVTDPTNIPINSLQDVDRLLVLVMEEFIGLYEQVISPFVNEMGNLLFGKSGENPISLFIIFGLPVMTAALSAIGVGTVAIVAAAWIFPLISLLFVPQLQ